MITFISCEDNVRWVRGYYPLPKSPVFVQGIIAIR